MYIWVSPRGVLANVLDCSREINELVSQSRYYGHFQTNILRKDFVIAYLSICGLNPISVIHKGDFSIK